MRFTKTLIGTGAIVAGLGILAVGAPANAATPAPAPLSIQFDLSGNDASVTYAQPSGHFTIASDSGFLAGQPVTMSATNLNGVQVGLITDAGSTGWTQTGSLQVMPGDANNIRLAAMGAGGPNYYSAYVRNLTIPTAGDQTIQFDLVPQNYSTLPSSLTHVVMASDNYFQPGSTTTTTLAVNDPVTQSQVSLDGGATWSATGGSFTRHPGEMDPTIMVKSFIKGVWVIGTMSNMPSPQLGLPAAATPVVNDPIVNTDGTITFAGTGTPGDTIIIRDASGTTVATTTVNPDGTWTSPAISDDKAGTGTVVQTGPGQSESADVPIIIPSTALDTPIINPLVGGGIALAAAAGLGTVLLVRRRKMAGATN